MTNNFRRTLKSKMHEQGLSQRQLAKKTGVPATTISSILKSKATGASVNLDHLKRLADALGITTHELAFGETDPHQNRLFLEESTELVYKCPIRILVTHPFRDC